MKDFLMLRYFVSCRFVPDAEAVIYEKHHPRKQTQATRDRDDPRNQILSAKEAHQIIETQKMVKVRENENGVIWCGAHHNAQSK